MKFIKALFVVILFLVPTKQNFAYGKTDKGILLELKQTESTSPKWLKIEILSDEIIHVSASQNKNFAAHKSLMVNNFNWKKVDWHILEEDGIVEISTPKILLKVNIEKGTISFYKADGELLLKERDDESKIFTSANVMGEQTFHIQQIFDSPDSEAFYGLGQHQNGIMNYKGHDVDLWQLNIVDVIPLLVSNKNYGILWDNNSRTKFGDIRDYQSISNLNLFDRDGNEGGLNTEYFSDSNFTNLYTSRNETKIEHEFIDVNDPYPEGFKQNVKAIRWSGKISADQSGIYKFRLYASNYVKFWLNGKLIADSWRQNWLPWTFLPKLSMEAGKKYDIKIEWIPNDGYIGLKYLTPEEDFYKKSISLYSEVADQIDYYFIGGDNIDQVIKGYRTITGKSPMMPKWAMGLWQCRQRYKTQDELLNVVKEFRKRQIPLDNIVQDWFYWPEDKWGDHDFDLTRYPDPKGMVNELHNKLNTHIMISVWPKYYVGTKNYDAFNEKGWLYKRNVEKGQKDWVGLGYVSTFYDAYSDGARKLYWEQINNKLFKLGFDAWWLDATEPDICSNLSRPEIRLRIGPTALGTSARYLNTFSLMNCKAVYEGQRNTNPNQRVFILTRSAFAGQQRYSAATWSGDVAARWQDLKNQISAGLNFCISGIPYWTTDIGGFAVEPRYENPNKEDLEEWRELNTRWFQFGTFCPLFRVHGEFPYREMFNVAPGNHHAYKSMLAYDKLRYRLMPYIYSLTTMVTNNDYTIMRALVMDFGNDKNVNSIGDQFMFGPSLLISPITEYKSRKRDVYLPNGNSWYNFENGKFYTGGETIIVDAPYEKIPIFVKEGSIIPCGPEMQYSDEKAADPIRVFVYTGADCKFNLYEDENTNYNYEKGLYSIIPLKYNETEKTLSIGNRKGEFPGMLKERTFEIIWISKENPSGLNFDTKPDSIIHYNGNEINVKLD